MTPTFVEKADGLMILGTPGGSYITGMVLLATLDWLDGLAPEEFVRKGRYHHQYMPDMLRPSPAHSPKTKRRHCRNMGTRSAKHVSLATCRSSPGTIGPEKSKRLRSAGRGRRSGVLILSQPAHWPTGKLAGSAEARLASDR